MTTQPIFESGMTFGPYPEGRFFYIEKSDCYETIWENVKMAEFLLLRTEKRSPIIWIVEAKSSAPNPKTQPKFDNYIDEIREKLINALSLGWASCLKRHEKAEAELPEDFKTLNLSQVEVKFVLVIKGYREEWLPKIQHFLWIALRPTIKCWAFAPNSVMVLNDALAQQKGLIFSGN